MAIDDLVKSLRDNTFHFDSLEMELVQGCEEKPATFRGSGFVEQDDTGVLRFKMYASEALNTNALSHLVATGSAQSGAVYKDDEYYSLTAVDRQGRRWTSDRLLPNWDWPLAGLPVISGRLHRVLQENGTAEGATRLRVHFFDDLELPVLPGPEGSGQQAKTQALGLAISISKYEHGTVVESMGEIPLPNDFAMRIHEAIKFLTGKPVAMRAIALFGPNGTQWELTSAPGPMPPTRMYPPMGRSTNGYFEHGLLLFARYLEFVTKNAVPGAWNSVTYRVHNATEASANSIDAWGVGVSVAVEGLATCIQIAPDERAKKLLHEFREWLLPLVEGDEQFSAFHARLGGLLGMMGDVRVKDRLLPLTATGEISADYLVAWTALRNKQVHPKSADLKKLAAGEVQEFLNLIHKVTTLMYQIVFHLIGYRGPYEDYGCLGFPTRDYPSPPASDPLD